MPSPSYDPIPPHFYIAYIDEAGDPGLRTVKPIDPNGASEWLTLGAIVIGAENEPTVPMWVKGARAAIGSVQGPALHFRQLDDGQKETVCQHTSHLRLRGFAICSHKPNMKGWRNPAAEAYPGPRGWFYNWCVRLLLERITDCVERDSIRKFGEPRHVKLVFSERGGVKYRWLSAYIELLMIQARKGSTYLPKRVIKDRVLHPKLIQVLKHEASAGAQLADVVTSAFYSAAHAYGSRWNTLPAEHLKPCMATERSLHLDYGVALQPTPAYRAALTTNQKKIFEFYGYDFRR